MYIYIILFIGTLMHQSIYVMHGYPGHGKLTLCKPIVSKYRLNIKGGYYDHVWIQRSKWSFWYQMKAPIFLITPVKFYVQQMLLAKVISENVAKVR